MAYRFVLSNPAVHVCMMAPTTVRQFEANMKEIREGGPLKPDETEFMKRFGDAVHHTKTKMFSRDDGRRAGKP
jgi:predicted aldo/keto reductase-like oxidoreductase